MAAAAAFAVPLPKSSPLSSRELNSSFLSGPPLKALRLPAKSRRSKDRTELTMVMAATAAGGETSGGGGRFYFNFTGFPFPLGPFLNRQTLRYEVSAAVSVFFKNFIWIFTDKRANFD